MNAMPLPTVLDDAVASLDMKEDGVRQYPVKVGSLTIQSPSDLSRGVRK